MEEIRQILAGLDWSPLLISIKTGIAATSQGCAGWDSDTAAGASADGCRIFPAAHFQYEKNRWIVSLYDI